jgi:Xaa-Pro aminopeptidase
MDKGQDPETTTNRRAAQPDVHRLRVPNLNELDFDQLRTGRLERLQQKLRLHDLPACLLFSPANIRYATGTDVMGVWTAGTFARYCLVPAEGAPVLFEYRTSMHVAERIVDDVRPAFSWQFGGGRHSWEKVREWAREIKATLLELGLDGKRLAVDRLDGHGFLALQSAGIEVLDAAQATVDAREIKTDDEIALMKINGGIGDAMLAAFDDAIRPGVREYELLAVLGDTLLRHHGEFLMTRLVASGTNSNPWMSEAHDKLVMPGDLVGVDTDASGFEGYVIDVSRTFLCGDTPTPEQKEAYRVAHGCVTGMLDLVKPGMSFEEFAHAAPRLPEKYREQRYVTKVHTAGLETEGPGIPYPEDDVGEGLRRTMPDRTIQENMILCLECYAGEVGAPFGVKLEDQVVVTATGCERLSVYPYEQKLLA